MKAKDGEHQWKFCSVGGLIQVQIETIDDVLNLDKLDPKLWTALACPAKGLEFSDETLNLLDLDHNGRVRVNELLDALSYIKKYLAKPAVIMEKGESIPLDSFSEETFSSGHTPAESAKAVLDILGKGDAQEISLEDVCVNDKLFSPGVINGDGVLPAECVEEEEVASVVKDIIAMTGGTDDISGVKGVNREQFEAFFAQLRKVRDWREAAVQRDPKIFFLKEGTDAAAKSFMKMRDKINDYYLRCSLIKYDSSAQEILKKQSDSIYLDENGELASVEQLSKLPLAVCEKNCVLPLDDTVNPVWASDMEEFKKTVILPIFQMKLTELSESSWRKMEALFEPYVEWYKGQPESDAFSLDLDRILGILDGNIESTIDAYLKKEEEHPPVALASVELKKLLLLRRDFVELVKNFVCFENFYRLDEKAIFQCGTLYIDGRSCELCFKVLDEAKHAAMASMSQCYLVYCDCVKKDDGEKMKIAALVSEGSTDSIIVGRNGIFYDRNGDDWDATITKIIDNPISLRQAFWSPYKKLGRLIQEKIASKTSSAESKVFDKMSKAVDDPKAAAAAAAPAKKTDIGTVAAIGVAVSGIGSLVLGVLSAFFGLGKWIPLGIIGIMMLISLPSVIIAYTKLRKRNIAPILDASGWAVNGNVKISPKLGNTLTHMPERPATAFLSTKDPYAEKKFPIKRVIFGLILLALAIWFVVAVIRNDNGVSGVWENIKTFFGKFIATTNKVAEDFGAEVSKAAEGVTTAVTESAAQ